MELLVVVAVALGGAFLSFFSGFGLGTLLLPAFLLWFPPPVALAATAVVHMLNNLFKLGLVGRHASWSVVWRFGITSVAGAWLGAWLVDRLAGGGLLAEYRLGSLHAEVTGVGLAVGGAILLFAFLESSGRLERVNAGPRAFPAGGLVSGFFGGLSGHQGALRSAFLLKAGLGREAFMGTRVVLACLVDLTRISVYFAAWPTVAGSLHWEPVAAATLAAFTGAWFGNRYMKKVSMPWIQRVVTVSLALFGAAMMAGWV